MSKEALKLALEALEKIVDGWTEAFAKYEYDSDKPINCVKDTK